MSRLDQGVPYSDSMEDKVGKKSSNKDTVKKETVPQPVLQLLKQTAEKFSSLDQEAEALDPRDANNLKKIRQKFEEKAQLLIELSKNLSGMLKGSDSEVAQRIIDHTAYFASEAQRALKEKMDFSLRVLLIPQGSKDGDPNNLEELIASLE